MRDTTASLGWGLGSSRRSSGGLVAARPPLCTSGRAPGRPPRRWIQSSNPRYCRLSHARHSPRHFSGRAAPTADEPNDAPPFTNRLRNLHVLIASARENKVQARVRAAHATPHALVAETSMLILTEGPRHSRCIGADCPPRKVVQDAQCSWYIV